MPSAVTLREDYSAEEFRALARRSKDVNQSRRLLSLAAVRDGMDRGSAARIGGMDRQTLRDWVHRFNAAGPEGLIDNWTEGPKPRLSAGQWADFAAIVEAGPDRERDGVVRWRRNWEHVIPFFAFPVAVRRIIYTTNAIESLNAKLRRAVRTRGHCPTDDAAIKLLYLVLRQVAQTWKMPPREWCEAKTQFAIMFDDRFAKA